MEDSEENTHVDVGAERVKLHHHQEYLNYNCTTYLC